MKGHQLIPAVVLFYAASLLGQGQPAKPDAHPAVSPATGQNQNAATSNTEDAAQLRADLQRLKVLLNQMRNNLAFVQSSQTPLKHQFELEADAWQLVVDQMDRRLRRMEDSGSRR